MQERAALYGPDLAVAEEAGYGHVTDEAPEQIAVVVLAAVHVLAASEAREQERTARTLVIGRIPGEPQAQILCGGLAVA